MPAIHGSLTNNDFIKANEIAKENGMEFKDWVTSIIVSEIRKLDTPCKSGKL